MRLVLFALLSSTLAAQAPPASTLYHPTPEERSQVERKIADLDAALRPLRAGVADDLVVDAEVYLKAAQWVLRFDEFYSKAYVSQTLAVLETGLQRARELAAGEPGWTKRKGWVSRAYRSRVDGSVQPYAVTIPQNNSPGFPEWLEVVLHGRGATLNEVSFLYSHDRATPGRTDHQFIQLDVFGRGNNAYRWAGETDVFEAIESVKKRYRIDKDRIVLRGFSMCGAGAWHLGLHYPDHWAAVEAGAGFVESKVYAKVTNPPPYVHIYDALDYAVNASNVPIVGYGGEDDPQLRASVAIREELEREGYKFYPLGPRPGYLRALFLVGPKTAHRWHPDSKKEADSFVGRQQSPGILQMSRLRFVTYTERYNSCFGLTIQQLERQYERAEVTIGPNERDPDDEMCQTRNVALLSRQGTPSRKTFTIDGQIFPMTYRDSFERVDGRWRPAQAPAGLMKSHGLQGPIDDAFMESFVCVPPSARIARSPVNDFALQQLDRFAREFPRWMRGDIRVKADRELTPAEIDANHIVVFGTPSTNPLIARTMRSAPIRWTKGTIAVGARKFDGKTHMLSMIYPNPSNPKRYIVINSGHTFHEADFKGTNALLYPRVGDWAITDVRTGAVVAEGVFDRNWRLPPVVNRPARAE
jgi:dienelactone hydrolase